MREKLICKNSDMMFAIKKQNRNQSMFLFFWLHKLTPSTDGWKHFIKVNIFLVGWEECLHKSENIKKNLCSRRVWKMKILMGFSDWSHKSSRQRFVMSPRRHILTSIVECLSSIWWISLRNRVQVCMVRLNQAYRFDFYNILNNSRTKQAKKIIKREKPLESL